MFGAIRIEHEGRVFYSNVALREHHLFQKEGRDCLFDVQRLSTHTLPDGVAPLIARIHGNPGCLVTEAAMTALREVGLVDEVDPLGATVGLPAERDPGTGQQQGQHPVTSIALFVAQKCNMRCVYCYGEGGEYSEPGMMDERTAISAVDWLMSNSFGAKEVQIGFFGGEPLLNFQLMETVARYARERAEAAGKSVSFSMTTNGTLLTDKMLAFLKAYDINPLVSYDGSTAYQNRQRPLLNGSGSSTQVRANLAKLKTVFPHLRGRATLVQDGDPFIVQQGLEDAGFTTCIISKASPVIARDERRPDPGPRENERSERLIAFTRGKIERVHDAIRERRLPEGNPPSILGDLKRMAEGRKKFYACGVGKGMAGVSASGDIYPCHRFVGLRDMRMGNIADRKAGPPTDYHRATVDDSPVCRSCWGRYLCGGGCFYENKAMTGDLQRPDPADCHEKLAGYEDIAYLYASLDADDWAYINGVIERAEKAQGPTTTQ